MKTSTTTTIIITSKSKADWKKWWMDYDDDEPIGNWFFLITGFFFKIYSLSMADFLSL
jgi:hypothetical protein